MLQQQKVGGGFSYHQCGADCLNGLYGTLEIHVDPFTDFARGTVGARALKSIDIGVRHAESFVAMQDEIV